MSIHNISCYIYQYHYQYLIIRCKWLWLQIFFCVTNFLLLNQCMIGTMYMYLLTILHVLKNATYTQNFFYGMVKNVMQIHMLLVFLNIFHYKLNASMFDLVAFEGRYIILIQLVNSESYQILLFVHIEHQQYKC